MFEKQMTRRRMLTLSAGSLLTLGLWPGALRAEGTGNPGNFHFLVVNDIHFMTDRCARFLERVVATAKAQPKPDFCLIAGDLTDHGTAAEFTRVMEAFRTLGVPMFPVIGNHDYLTQKDRSDYEKLFPDRLNYYFDHQGWLLVGLDTTQGMDSSASRIQEPTLRWLDDNLPKLNKKSPLVVFTHFPLGERVMNRPVNAEGLLERLKEHNLRGIFSGHFHASTERRLGDATLVTNRCCSVSRSNHDGSRERGYFLCEAKEGAITRTFVEVDTKNLG